MASTTRPAQTATLSFRKRRQTPDQPHQFQVATGLLLEPTRGLDPVEVAVEVDLEHRAGVIRRTARRLRLHAFKAERRQVERLDKGINHADGVFFSDVFVQSARRVTGLDDALDGFEREGAEACSMTECLVDGVGSVALP